MVLIKATVHSEAGIFPQPWTHEMLEIRPLYEATDPP